MAYIGIDTNGVRYKIAMGIVITDNDYMSIDIGFKPKYLFIQENNPFYIRWDIYDSDVSETKYQKTTEDGSEWKTFDEETTYGLYDINNNGFEIHDASLHTKENILQ